jgi:hypothetical protein
MKSHLYLLKEYLATILKSWILWLFIVCDFIGLIVSSIYSKFNIPQPVFLLIALIAFIFAGYKAYYDILKSIPEKYKPGISKLLISLIEGNSYNFSFVKQGIKEKSEKKKTREKSVNDYKYIPTKDGDLPVVNIDINLRIQNNGDIPLNIISINSDFAFDVRDPYRFMVPHVLTNSGNSVHYPILIAPNDVITFKIDYDIWPKEHFTEAQIAIKIFNNNKEDVLKDLEISVEVSNQSNEINKFANKFIISMKPLYDLLYSYWKIRGKKEILSLLNISNK